MYEMYEICNTIDACPSIVFCNGELVNRVLRDTVKCKSSTKGFKKYSKKTNMRLFFTMRIIQIIVSSNIHCLNRLTTMTTAFNVDFCI